MSIALYRVDERLIHGQVVVAWGNLLHPERIVVVDDALADSTWEQELYTLGLPADRDARSAGASRTGRRSRGARARFAPRRTCLHGAVRPPFAAR